MTAALALRFPLPATTRVHVRCPRCHTLDTVTVDAAELDPRGAMPLAFCTHCDPPTLVVAADFTPDIHSSCDGDGCTECRWTGLDQRIPQCSMCEARDVVVHRHGEGLCVPCDAVRAAERDSSALRRRAW